MIRTASIKGVLVLACAAMGFSIWGWLSIGAAEPNPPATSPRKMDPQAAGLHLVLGVSDEEQAEWDGTITPSEGTVNAIEYWRPLKDWKLEGNHFTVPAPEDNDDGKDKAKNRARRAGRPKVQLYLTLSAPPTASVELTTNNGTATFNLADVSDQEPLELLDGRASVQRTPVPMRITESGPSDDFPTVAAGPNGAMWLAYVSYQHGTPIDLDAVEEGQFDSLITRDNGDRILLVEYDGKGEWSAPLEVTEGLCDVWRPTVAVDGKGGVWVSWSQKLNDDWNLYRRRWDPAAGKWSAIERMTDAPGADINVASVADSLGNVWWAWQGWRGDNFDIVVASTKAGQQAETIAFDSPANEWNPALAADSAGNVYVGWDTYAAGNYDVYVQRFGSDAGEPIKVAATPDYEARVSLACDAAKRLWIAHEHGDPDWGKDYGSELAERPVENVGSPLYGKRTIEVTCLTEDGLLDPTADLQDAFADAELNRSKSFPRIAVDGGGHVWLWFRHHPLSDGAGENWSSYAMRYEGDHWTSPQFVPSTDYLLDSRPALAPLKAAGLLAVFTSDARLRGGGVDRDGDLYAPTPKDRDNDLYAVALSAEAVAPSPSGRGQGEGSAGKRMGEVPKLVPHQRGTQEAVPIHPDEPEAIARMRSYRIEHTGKTYQLLRGEFHRHTEYTSHRDQDGALEDMWRYAWDAAAMDWLGNGDHDNGNGREYSWWIIQKLADIFHHPPRFVAPFTYERSVVYPNGHRNVMLARRGIRTLPRGELLGTPEEGTPDTKNLYAYLHHFGGICAVHTSGTGMGTDWRDNDPEVEPVVEIYQGMRHNYEHYGAPRSPTAERPIGGYQPAGFVWNALARGYRLGFQSSSDHLSTHMSYAVALVEEVSREGLIEAFGKRHCYAATDNIVLDVRSGEHLMGDEFSADKAIRLEVKVIGTAPIGRIDVIKNNGYVYSVTAEEREAEFEWEEANQPAGTLSYYYVRVEQDDGQLAWSSPIWVRYE